MTKVTVGQILDLIDNSRESDEIICVMGNNGKVQGFGLLRDLERIRGQNGQQHTSGRRCTENMAW